MWNDYIWNPSTCSCKDSKYLESIINTSVITCDEIIDAEEKKKLFQQALMKNKACKTQGFYILLAV